MTKNANVLKIPRKTLAEPTLAKKPPARKSKSPAAATTTVALGQACEFAVAHTGLPDGYRFVTKYTTSTGKLRSVPLGEPVKFKAPRSGKVAQCGNVLEAREAFEKLLPAGLAKGGQEVQIRGYGPKGKHSKIPEVTNYKTLELRTLVNKNPTIKRLVAQYGLPALKTALNSFAVTRT